MVQLHMFMKYDKNSAELDFQKNIIRSVLLNE